MRDPSFDDVRQDAQIRSHQTFGSASIGRWYRRRLRRTLVAVLESPSIKQDLTGDGLREFRRDAGAIRTLSPERYRVTQQNGTEATGTGEAALRFIHRDEMEAQGYGAYLDQVEDRK